MGNVENMKKIARKREIGFSKKKKKSIKRGILPNLAKFSQELNIVFGKGFLKFLFNNSNKGLM
jgi:hypothetical protein